MIEKSKKTLEVMPQSRKAESRPTVPSGSDDFLGGRLPSGYLETSLAFDDTSRLHVLNSCQPPCFHKLETDEKYELVATILRALFI